MPVMVNRPMIKDKSFAASKGDNPESRNGANNQESNGLQYPLIALRKSPFRYF